MIVDTSAIMAIVLGEPEGSAFTRELLASPGARISAGTRIEITVVIKRKRIEPGERLVEALIDRAGIMIAPVSALQARLASDAYRRFGQGSGSPARLNFGDCFAYALAKETGEPLLFKGENFIHTDIESAL